MKIFNRKAEEEKVEEEIISMVNEGNEQGLIEDDEKEMITNIFEFSEKEARDVMTPRTNVVAFDKSCRLVDIMDDMLEYNYSRYPVYDGDIDNIVGIVYFKDFVREYLKHKESLVESVMVEPYFVHPTRNISKLFKQMQNDKIHMAIITDEYGQTDGVISMEDILEEIVGNIFDEYDDEEDEVRRVGNDYVVDGTAELDEISELLGIEFPDEDFQTINGFLLYELGRLPFEHEDIQIEYQGYRFTTTGHKNKMIDKVRITKVEKSSV